MYPGTGGGPRRDDRTRKGPACALCAAGERWRGWCWAQPLGGHGGFLVVLPFDDRVIEAMRALKSDDGEDLVLEHRARVELETVRGRTLGKRDVYFVDVPWEGVSGFTKSHPLRGAAARELRLTAFSAEGVSARPRTVSVLRAAARWVQTAMDSSTAAEYVTGEDEETGMGVPETAVLSEDEAEVDGQPVEEQEMVSFLQDRIRQLEAVLNQRPQPQDDRTASGRSAPLLARPSQGLDTGALERLRSLAGPPPRQPLLGQTPKVAAPRPPAVLRDSLFREAELGALPEVAAEDPFVGGRLSTGSPAPATGSVGGSCSAGKAAGRRSSSAKQRPGQRKRQLRHKRMLGEGSLFAADPRPPDSGGDRSCQRAPRSGARQRRSESDEDLHRKKTPACQPPPPGARSPVRGRGVGGRSAAPESRASGLRRPSSDICGTSFAGQRTPAARVAARRLRRAASPAVEQQPTELPQAVFFPGTPQLGSRQHRFSSRPRLFRESDEFPQQQGEGRATSRGCRHSWNRCKRSGPELAPSKAKGKGEQHSVDGGLGSFEGRGVLGRGYRPASGGSHEFPERPLPDLDPSSTKPLCPAELVQYTLRALRSGCCGLSWFIKLSLRDPACAAQITPAGDSLWPIPPPRWRWFGQGRSSKSRRRRRYFQTRAHLLQVVVCSLNWQTLGFPLVPPRGCTLGCPINPAQHRVLEHLEGLLDHFLSAPSFSPEALGRCGPKFSAFASIAQELPSNNRMDVDLFAKLAKALHVDFDAYSKAEASREPSAPEPAPMSTANVRDTGSLEAPVLPSAPARASAGGSPAETLSRSLRELDTLKVTASRIKWKHPPEFDPLPYLDDPLLRAAYIDPEVLRLPSSQWAHARPALVHAERNELLALARAWDAHGALCIFGADELNALDQNEEVGLFAVSKDLEWDRLIINPTVVNGRMLTRNTFSKGLSPGWLLSSLHLQPFEGLRYHAADLSDFYHSFKVSRRRALRNRVRARFHAHELRGLSSFDPSLREPLGIGLNTLAMGDNLAVEVAQAAHTGLLRKLCGCMLPGEVLRYREPVPRGSFIEALAIDDHVCLQKLPLAELPFADDARDARIFGMAADAYAGVGLRQNRKKDKVNCTSGVVLGAELDGIKGVVCAPRERVHCLCMLTGFVARRGSCTPELLDSLLGCWIHVLLFRRPLFCIIDGLFGEGKGYGRTRVFRLSQKARNELFLLSVLGGLAQSDLRAQYHDSLFALDASPWGGAVCSAAVGAQASAELWRYGEQRGYYTRLASPASAVLLEHSLEHDGDRAFGDTTIGDTDHRAPLRPFNLTRPLAEGILYDAVELFRGVGNWSEAHAKVGLRVHSGLSAKTCKGLSADILDDAVCRDLMSLAARRVVREWHAGVPGHTYGTLRRPRLRSHACPFGFKPSDPLTLEHTRIARRAALILTLAVRCGQLISVEQPSGSCLYRLACFQRLASLGCVLTSFCFCSFGSPFRKRSLWLHNKPWVAELAGDCVCKWKGKHFSARGWHFDSKSVREFVSRCRPSCEAV